MLDDTQILQQIEKLVEEERALREHGERGLEELDRARLDALEVALDQCWDLLRQRRGLRDRGEDPDQATVRDPGTVEGYRQ